jgi:hypothetical protein
MCSDLLPFLRQTWRFSVPCSRLSADGIVCQHKFYCWILSYWKRGGEGNFTNRDCLLSSLLAGLEGKRVISNCKVYLPFIRLYLTNNAANLEMFQCDINLQLLKLACVYILGMHRKSLHFAQAVFVFRFARRDFIIYHEASGNMRSVQTLIPSCQPVVQPQAAAGALCSNMDLYRQSTSRTLRPLIRPRDQFPSPTK